MENERVNIVLIPAPADEPLESPAYQKELRGFKEALEAHAIKVSPQFMTMDAAAELSFLTGRYTGAFGIAEAALPMIGGFVAWIQGRYGRKVRLRIRDVEAETRTVNEVKDLLKAAKRADRKRTGQKRHRL